MISYPAPAMCQYEDQKLVLEIGNIIFANTFEQMANENNLRIWVDGDEKSHPHAGAEALARFQVALGLLRSWAPDTGRLAEEVRGGLGEGPVRDEQGAQHVFLDPVVTYNFTTDVIRLAESAARGIEASLFLRNSLQLNGRANRTSADYYMIHEYACIEFGGSRGVTSSLGVSGKAQKRLTESANNLSPLLGGRHAKESRTPPLDLDAQGELISELLRAWIGRY